MSVDVEETFRRLTGNRTAEAAGKTTVALILSLIVVFNVLFISWGEAKKSPGVDFFTFWSVAQTVRQGDIAEIYSPEGSSEFTTQVAGTLRDPHLSDRQRTATRSLLQFENGNVGIIATPFLFTTLSLWAHGDFDRDLTVFAFCCLVAYALSVFMLGRVFGFGAITSALLLTLLLIGFSAYASDVRVGGTNQLQLFAIALFLWLRRKPGLYQDVGAGLVLGVAVMFKPDVALVAVLLAVVWICNRRFATAKRVFASAFGGAFLALLVSSAFFGTPACWAQWMRVAPAIVQSKWNGGLDLGNYGFATVLHRILSVDLSVILLLVLLGAFGYVVWKSRMPARVGRHGRSIHQAQDRADSLFVETASAVCLGLTFMLLSSKLVWFHYYVLAIPAIIFAFSLSFQAGNSAIQATAPRVLTIVGVLCLMRVPAELLPVPVVVQALVLNVGVVLLSLVIGYGLLTRNTECDVVVAESNAR